MIEIELIVGTMGLRQILADRLPKYSKALLDRAGTTLKTFKSGANDFKELNKPGRLPKEEFTIDDFGELSKLLQDDQEIMTAVEGLATWPSELQMEITVLIADVKAYLMQQLPTSQVTGSMAGFSLPPSDSDKFRFIWQANLCDDIREFVTLLNSGSITPIESALMRTLFPQTHDFLIVEVMDHVLEAAVSGDIEDWEGSWRKPALSGLLGVPVDNFQDVMQAQTGMQEKTAGRPNKPGAMQTAQLNLTTNQSIDSKNIDQSKI